MDLNFLFLNRAITALLTSCSAHFAPFQVDRVFVVHLLALLTSCMGVRVFLLFCFLLF